MDFDLIVVGAGSGGIAAARRASSHGVKVLLVESGKIGGTCVNVGCVPKKVSSNLCQILLDSKYLHKSYSLMRNKDRTVAGSDLPPTSKRDLSLTVDYPAFKAARDAYIRRLNGIYDKIIQNDRNITYLQGHANVYPDHVEVNDHKYAFKHCLLATGSKSKELNIHQGNDEATDQSCKKFVKTSDDFFNLSEIPKKVVVIGSGYIGIEIATILNAMGSDVTVVARNNKLLSHFDDVLGSNVRDAMEKQGIRILFEAKIISINQSETNKSQIEALNEEKSDTCPGILSKKHKTDEKHDTGDDFGETTNKQNCDIRLKTPDGGCTIKDVDFVMCAIGRDCDLSFIKCNVEHENTYLKVDGNFQTTAKNIYAVGDLLGPPFMLTPYAIYCGRLLSDHLFKRSVDSIRETFQIETAVPSVIFSHPPCATIGLSEKEALARSSNVKIHESTFSNMLFCFQDQEEKEKSIFKIVTIADKVVGLHLFGTGSDEIIQGFAVAMKMGATYDDFKNTVPVHPTAAEEVITMK